MTGRPLSSSPGTIGFKTVPRLSESCIPGEPPFRGQLITVDGIDGVGKSTQIARLVASLRSRGDDVLSVRDPGSTPIGARLRSLLLESDLEIHRRTEAMLFMASRCEMIETVIRPALARGQTVVSDRFLLSNVVYQSVGPGGVDPQRLWDLGRASCGGLGPAMTVLLDLPAAVAVGRINRPADRMEARGVEYLEAVRQAFLNQLPHAGGAERGDRCLPGGRGSGPAGQSGLDLTGRRAARFASGADETYRTDRLAAGSSSEPRDAGRLCDRSHRVPAWDHTDTPPFRWQDSLRVAAHVRTFDGPLQKYCWGTLHLHPPASLASGRVGASPGRAPRLRLNPPAGAWEGRCFVFTLPRVFEWEGRRFAGEGPPPRLRLNPPAGAWEG